MRIRQIALVAVNLDKALLDLHDVLGIDVGFRDPGVGVFGLHNGVMPIGEQFLEVVSPKQPDTTAGRYIERRRGDGGYMVIFQTRDLAARRRRFSAHAVRTVFEVELDDVSTIHLHPRDTGGAIVSVDEARPWESWRWAGPDWREHVRTDRVRGIAGVEIQSEDPRALADRWATLFDLRPAAGPQTLALEDGGRIVFTKAEDGRGEGLRSVILHATDAAAVRRAAASSGIPADADGAIPLVGTRFFLED